MNLKSENGFSYIDVMIALVILMFGILSMLVAISWSMVQAAGHEQQLLAKQIATSTIESIMAVKETDPSRLGWPAVGNVGSNPDPVSGVAQGIFPIGFQPVKTDAGADQVIGTADDTGTTVSQVQRRIVITDVCDPDRPSPGICSPAGPAPVRIRSVNVTVMYNVGGLQRQESVQTVLTDYAVVN
ncbi:MAG: type II secretion system protein [Pyrinomonadaceae bacterium]